MVLGGVLGWGGGEEALGQQKAEVGSTAFRIYLVMTVDQPSYKQIEKEPKKIKLMIMEGRFLRWRERGG